MGEVDVVDKPPGVDRVLVDDLPLRAAEDVGRGQLDLTPKRRCPLLFVSLVVHGQCADGFASRGILKSTSSSGCDGGWRENVVVWFIMTLREWCVGSFRLLFYEGMLESVTGTDLLCARASHLTASQNGSC